MRSFGIRFVAAVGAVVCVVSGCGGPTGRGSQETSQGPAAAAVVPIEVAAVVRQDVPVVVHATGTFAPDESSDVASAVSGQVVKMLVNVGDIVNPDQPLALLDDRDARLRLEQAHAALERAQADAQHAKTDASRSNELYQKGFTSRSDFERLATQDTGAGATVAQAKAQVASAQKAVDDTVVRAPFSGHVTARPIAAGEYVTPASKIATIVRIHPIKLELQVKEADAVKVRRGLTVQAEVSGYPGVLFDGAVSALNVAIDPNSRAMTVEATFPNPDTRVTPGMFGSAQIRLSATEPALFVPMGAALRVADSDAMYVVADNRAQLRVVQLGEGRNGMIRVDAGLEEGAVVATSNLDKLFDGAQVRVAETPAVATQAERSQGGDSGDAQAR